MKYSILYRQLSNCCKPKYGYFLGVLLLYILCYTVILQHLHTLSLSVSLGVREVLRMLLSLQQYFFQSSKKITYWMYM
jgi:hypothetical protein